MTNGIFAGGNVLQIILSFYSAVCFESSLVNHNISTYVARVMSSCFNYHREYKNKES